MRKVDQVRLVLESHFVSRSFCYSALRTLTSVIVIKVIRQTSMSHLYIANRIFPILHYRLMVARLRSGTVVINILVYNVIEMILGPVAAPDSMQ